MRLTQAVVVAILAFTAAAMPIAVRGDDAKATQEYQKCCEQRDKYDHSKICTPKVEVPHVPKPVEDGKYPDGDDDGKDHHPEVPKEEEHKDEEEKPKPVSEHPEVPEHKDEHEKDDLKPEYLPPP
jgi:hypothetical protein